MTRGDIVLVEDNKTDAMVIARTLEEKGNAPVKVLDSKDSASRYFGSLPPVPRLIILDINLPDGSGLDILLEIRRENRYTEVPVVMLSSSACADLVSSSYRNGANCYISKPTSMESFERALEKLYTYWFTTSRTPSN